MSEHKPVKMLIFHDADNNPAMCATNDFHTFIVADNIPIIKRVFEATTTHEATKVFNEYQGIKDFKFAFADCWLDDRSYVRKPLHWLYDKDIPRTKQILDAIHVPEMDEIADNEEALFWIFAPNHFAGYWTVGYRLERTNRTQFGYRSPTTLIEVYYAKIAPQQVDNPEWLPKFAVEFKAKYMDALTKLKASKQ